MQTDKSVLKNMGGNEVIKREKCRKTSNLKCVGIMLVLCKLNVLWVLGVGLYRKQCDIFN